MRTRRFYTIKNGKAYGIYIVYPPNAPARKQELWEVMMSVKYVVADEKKAK